MGVNDNKLATFEELVKKLKSCPEKEQRDICLIIQGYLVGRAAEETTKVS